MDKWYASAVFKMIMYSPTWSQPKVDICSSYSSGHVFVGHSALGAWNPSFLETAYTSNCILWSLCPAKALAFYY